MAWKYNIFTGELDQVGSSTAPVSTTDYHVNKITLSAGDITAKSVTLTGTPVTLADSRLIVLGGLEQEYGADFTISGSVLSWSALGLDGVLVAGDKLIVVFN